MLHAFIIWVRSNRRHCQTALSSPPALRMVLAPDGNAWALGSLVIVLAVLGTGGVNPPSPRPSGRIEARARVIDTAAPVAAAALIQRESQRIRAILLANAPAGRNPGAGKADALVDHATEWQVGEGLARLGVLPSGPGGPTILSLEWTSN